MRIVPKNGNWRGVSFENHSLVAREEAAKITWCVPVLVGYVRMGGGRGCGCGDVLVGNSSPHPQPGSAVT
jgi:hypothetical protein